FQSMSASPRGQTSLKVAVGEPFTTRCATCGRTLPLDEVVWPGAAGPDDVTDPAEPFGAGPAEPADAANSVPSFDRDHPAARQLVGLEAILDRIEGDLRAAPVEAALRLAFLHALLPASRLNGYPGRVGTLRIQAGRVRPPSVGQWRERHPWLAFEDGIRTVR